MVAIGVVANDVTVLIEIVAQEVARQPVPLLPAGRHVLAGVAVEILTEEGRLVAVFFKPGSQRRPVAAREAKPLGTSEGRLVVEDVVVVGVLATQDGGPARAAK